MPYTQKDILNEIHKKREIMINLGLTKGLNNQATIKCSQELDLLINQYQASFRHQKREFNIKFKSLFINANVVNA